MKSRHEPVPQPTGQSASTPKFLVTQPCLDCFFQAAGVTFQLPREGRRACLSVVCSLLLFSLLSFFRAGFPGVVQKQGLCCSHFGHPRGWSGWLCRISLKRQGSIRLREGSGTKSTGRRPKNRASFRVALQYVRRWYGAGYGRIYRCSGSSVLCSTSRNFGMWCLNSDLSQQRTGSVASVLGS